MDPITCHHPWDEGGEGCGDSMEHGLAVQSVKGILHVHLEDAPIAILRRNVDEVLEAHGHELRGAGHFNP